MRGRIVGIMLVLLMFEALIFPFNVQIGQATAAKDAVRQGPILQSQPTINAFLQSQEDFQKLDFDNDGKVELVLGVGASECQVQNLENKILKTGADIEDSIRAGKSVRAITVKVRAEKAKSFLNQISMEKPVTYVEPDFRVEATMIPNDPYWSQQWGPKKIQADYAWNTTIGSSDILVAIVDTGIDYGHPELAANYVPLGYNWVSNNSDVMDDYGHGTHCAGIVAANINNGIGVAGLAQVRVMAEKVLCSGGWGYYSWVAEGIYHATDVGAKIISMSLGGPEPSTVLHDALEYAQSHGVLLVAAAGNDHSDTPSYPAVYDECIAVSATDSSDTLASFSNYGDWIDVAAPGVNIYSTLPTYHVTLNDPPYSRNESYDYLSGTSMACPHVTGTAALVWSLSPRLPSSVIRNIIESTADDLGAPGFDDCFGHGRINAKKAVSAVHDHDICISKWEYPHRIDPGKTVMFNATISNFGRNDESNISVHYFVNGTLASSKIIDFLGVGSSSVVSFSYSTTTLGFYNFTCFVVPVPAENVTENNVVSSIVKVRVAGILRVPSEYATIKIALNNASDGDTVLVRYGIYTEGQIDVDEDDVALVADGQVFLDGQRGARVLNVNAANVIIKGFTLTRAKIGVCLKGLNNTFTCNSVQACVNGIWLRESYNSTISSTSITLAPSWEYPPPIPYCIKVDHALNNTLSHNILKEGAMWLYYSNNNSFVANEVSDSNFGVLLQISIDNIFRNNSIMDNTRNFGVWKWDYQTWPYRDQMELKYPSQAINDIDTSNTVDGKPIYYLINKHDKIVPSDAGCVVLIYCNNITIENVDIRDNLNGILLLDSNNTSINENSVQMTHPAETIYDWFEGGIVTLFESSNNTITSNNLARNYWGIYIDGGSANAICHNTLTGVYTDGMTVNSEDCIVMWNTVKALGSSPGMEVDGQSNLVAFNHVSCYAHAILAEGTNQTISENLLNSSTLTLYLYLLSNSTLTSNDIYTMQHGEYDFPIALASGCVNCLIAHNNVHASLAPSCVVGPNRWDGGYPSGGNYWSQYTGSDVKKGPNQNESGSDGIGDTPYVIDANNQDRYPLMKPYPWSSHDIGVTSVSVKTSKTVIAQGYDVPITVTVMVFNYGNSTETFNVTTYANTAEIGTKETTLTAGNFTTVKFTWNTAGFAKGNYTISAYAHPVQGETDTADNTLKASIQIKITIPGDIDGDFHVTILDLVKITSIYASKQGDPKFDPSSDIDGDGKITILDVVICTSHYGKHYP